MTDLITITPDGYQSDDGGLFANATPKDRLREAILNVELETERLTALQQAQSRAKEQLWYAESALADVRGALQRARREEPQRKAYAFLNAEAPHADPIGEAEAAVQAAQADVNQLNDIQAALAAERSRIEYELRELCRLRDTAMVTYLIESDEFELLLAQHRDAFARLRTIKMALRVIVRACRGQLPQHLMNEVALIEPLDDAIGYSIDRTVIESWAIAMKELERDADQELPMFG